ncbi:hypothetical protein RSAG8_07236, partial [Rhizoctonia solani AG-8 WAC10335]
MSVVAALDSPKMNMAFPELEMGHWDEWVLSPPLTPILDEDMRSSFDDDVEIEEAWRDEDEDMGEVHANGDIVMRDWTDEDVEMTEVTYASCPKQRAVLGLSI